MILSVFQKNILSALVAVLILVYLIIESWNCGDFLIFLSASKDLFHGENIYLKTYFDGYHYFYSIAFAILLYPFTFINPVVATFIWLALNVFLLYRLYKIIDNLLPITLTKKQRIIFWILTGVFSLRLVAENIHVGQVTIFILYLCVEGLSMIARDKKFYGALLIAAGINIKLLPIVLIPYLIFRKEFLAACWIVGLYVALLYLPVLLIGVEHNHLLLGTWAELINPLNKNHVLDVDERSFHGLSTLLSTLLVANIPDTFALTIKRNIANVNLEHLNTILMITRLILAGMTLYFLRTRPFKPSINKRYYIREICYQLLIIPLIFPHQQHYAFLFIIPAYSYCILCLIQYREDFSPSKRKLLMTLMIIIYLTVNLKTILGQFNAYYEHFKILTYGAILLIIVLAMLKPKPAMANS